MQILQRSDQPVPLHLFHCLRGTIAETFGNRLAAQQATEFLLLQILFDLGSPLLMHEEKQCHVMLAEKQPQTALAFEGRKTELQETRNRLLVRKDHTDN